MIFFLLLLFIKNYKLFSCALVEFFSYHPLNLTTRERFVHNPGSICTRIAYFLLQNCKNWLKRTKIEQKKLKSV